MLLNRKLAHALAEETPSDPAELKAKLDIIVQVHEKFQLLMEEYYETVPEEDFEEIEIILVELDDEIQMIEWTDSSIVLSWISASPHLLKTFVANRVSQIQQLSKDFQWRHIFSKCNPTDALSGCLDAKTLVACELWWTGPEPSILDISTQDVVEIPIISLVQLYCAQVR
ncbi:integrase_H2C2 domain-containing protein [Trichonephila clavipes]|uniref:Integrase_H2C2 domain-containing protein n=1 Tax=Trichonephila clavipes TaxID=2585209 RepID=A0A8X6VQR1_TRICX|nr:integrase_H2C2 domain-containing protein [Trichonephila clavipes]